MPLQRVAGQPTWLLSRAHARSQAILGAAFAAAGVRGYHYRLMAALEQHGRLSQADLGRKTGIDRKDVALAVAELADRRLLVRAPDAADRRRNVVTLTESGRRELEALDEILAGVQDEVLAPLSAAERRTLLTLLSRLATGDDCADR